MIQPALHNITPQCDIGLGQPTMPSERLPVQPFTSSELLPAKPATSK